ncbi:MAG: hypothetical protein C0412_20375 [Flavobacterium sp.]|nr:hypothetical protein [Flavobacterium sp.]
MEANVQEKQNQSDLNQARAGDKKESDETRESAPVANINIAEMVIILGAAITVDLIDALDLTGFGAILVRFIDIPTLGALWLWRVLKQQAGPKKDPTFAILLAFLTELSPIGIIPTWSTFVLYTYFQDTKLGKQTIGKAQKLTQAKK